MYFGFSKALLEYTVLIVQLLVLLDHEMLPPPCFYCEEKLKIVYESIFFLIRLLQSSLEIQIPEMFR